MAKKQHGAVTKPITIAAHGSTKPAAGVMATRPATKPVHAPTSVGLPTRIRSTSIHDNMPAAEATIVLSNARAATPSAANCEPALKPNQPNHKSVAPKTTNGTLCAR